MIYLPIYVLAFLVSVSVFPPMIEKQLIARTIISYKLQRIVARLLSWPRPLSMYARRIAKQVPHDESRTCLPCLARIAENKYKHVERLYADVVRCERCGLPRAHWRTLPRCKGKWS